LGAIIATSGESRIRALVSISAFADPVEITRQVMAYTHIPRWPFLWLVCRIIEGWIGASMAAVTPKNRIAHVDVPTLLIHGDSDPLVSPSNMETLRARAPKEKTESWLVSGAGHSDLIEDNHCGERVVSFLRRSLMNGQPERDEKHARTDSDSLRFAQK
jgi:pimeloyl-ACP methyl ester carboxylesterase